MCRFETKVPKTFRKSVNGFVHGTFQRESTILQWFYSKCNIILKQRWFCMLEYSFHISYNSHLKSWKWISSSFSPSTSKSKNIEDAAPNGAVSIFTCVAIRFVMNFSLSINRDSSNLFGFKQMKIDHDHHNILTCTVCVDNNRKEPQTFKRIKWMCSNLFETVLCWNWKKNAFASLSVFSSTRSGEKYFSMTVERLQKEPLGKMQINAYSFESKSFDNRIILT